MIKLSLLLASLSLSLSLVNCSTFQATDWQAGITLPASQDCYEFNVMSGKETRTAADSDECKKKKERSIWLTFDNYKKLRRDIQNNCQFDQCTQITGALDSLFLTIDQGLQKIPVP